jgi:hypothetical protein
MASASFSSAIGIPSPAIRVRAPANTIRSNSAGGKTRRAGRMVADVIHASEEAANSGGLRSRSKLIELGPTKRRTPGATFGDNQQVTPAAQRRTARRWTPATLIGVSGRPTRASALSTDSDKPLFWE